MLPFILFLLAGAGFVASQYAAPKDVSNKQATAQGPVFGVDSNYLSVAGVKDSGVIGLDNKPAGLVRQARDLPNTYNYGLNQTGQQYANRPQSNGVSDLLKQIAAQTADRINTPPVAAVTTPSASSPTSAPAAAVSLIPAQPVVYGTPYSAWPTSAKTVVYTPYWQPGITDNPNSGVVYNGPPINTNPNPPLQA